MKDINHHFYCEYYLKLMLNQLDNIQTYPRLFHYGPIGAKFDPYSSYLYIYRNTYLWHLRRLVKKEEN